MNDDALAPPNDPCGLDVAGWKAWAEAAGLPPYRGEQAFHALHRGHATTWEKMTALPAAVRRRLAREDLLPGREIARQESRDGTAKSFLAFADRAGAECVGIPDRDRHTVCVSTQSGCPIGCSFCASGRHGLDRDLTAGEIVTQVLHHQRLRPVTNVVFMGSGEPLLNLDAVLRAIRVLGEPAGLHLGRRRFVVSTCGVPDGIRRLAAEEPQITLALSLHACRQDLRERLVPAAKRWRLDAVLDAVDHHFQATHRRPTFEYCLLADANMAAEDAEALASLARAHHAHINLIAFNAVEGLPHRAPTPDQARAFTATVVAAGGNATLRASRGCDIAAACGQLAGAQRE